jgi:regulator of RNase E activity RraA
MKKLFILFILILQVSGLSFAQIVPTIEKIVYFSSEWKGDRDQYGRPMISDNLLDRLLNLSIEEVWGVLRNEGYNNQFESGWQILWPEKPFVGRALTVQYMPTRPDMANPLKKTGEAEKRIGAPNSWPIDLLKKRDVYVADGFGKVINGTLIGDNLGNSIFSKSGTGVVFDGGVRDIEGLAEIKGFNCFTRGADPSYIMEMTMTGINVPIRIGRATVLPGDAVLAKKEGVIFIPAQLVQKVVLTGEFVGLRDKFGHEMLQKGVYTPGQIDARWTDEIKNAFLKWLDVHPEELPMSRKELDDFMKDRTW